MVSWTAKLASMFLNLKFRYIPRISYYSYIIYYFYLLIKYLKLFKFSSFFLLWKKTVLKFVISPNIL